jgi:hypothetical protein
MRFNQLSGFFTVFSGIEFRLAPTPALPMNLVAADVRRLILFPAKEVRASLRRLYSSGGNARKVSGNSLPHREGEQIGAVG